MDDKQFESLVQVWMTKIKPKRGYLGVLRFGGSGDMGRDVIGWMDNKKCGGVWDNVQCKQQKAAFSPTDMWPEAGKILWHAWKGDYAVPRSVEFLCSAGIGTKTKHLLTHPEKLREGLIKNWEVHVEKELTSTPIPLSPPLKAFVLSADFSIFKPLAVEEVIDDIRGTAYFAEEFGGELPTRPPTKSPPTNVQAAEAGYVNALLAAYAQRRSLLTLSITELDNERRDRRHFDMCRRQFYSAEALREFARDFWPEQTFQHFKEGISDAVMPAYYNDYPNGLARVNAVLTAAASSSVTTSLLNLYAEPRDKEGVCHQLANEGDFTWVAP